MLASSKSLRAIALFGVVAILLTIASGCSSRRIHQLLSETPGVDEVAYFLNYEGRIEADIVLENGGFISLHNLREQSFARIDQIYVSRIHDFHISCSYTGQLGLTGSGHNIIAIVGQLEGNPSEKRNINNITDLVANYDYVVEKVDRLPLDGEGTREFTFPHRQPEVW